MSPRSYSVITTSFLILAACGEQKPLVEETRDEVSTREEDWTEHELALIAELGLSEDEIASIREERLLPSGTSAIQTDRTSPPDSDILLSNRGDTYCVYKVVTLHFANWWDRWNDDDGDPDCPVDVNANLCFVCDPPCNERWIHFYRTNCKARVASSEECVSCDGSHWVWVEE
jgi:hypothetical protein